jgi:hypothetical protein
MVMLSVCREVWNVCGMLTVQDRRHMKNHVTEAQNEEQKTWKTIPPRTFDLRYPKGKVVGSMTKRGQPHANLYKRSR